MEFSYAYSPGTRNPKDIVVGKTSDSNDVKKFLDKVTQPERSVSIDFGLDSGLTKPDWVSVVFAFYKDNKTKNNGIEMEIMPYDGDMNFASVDIPIAKQIADIMFKLSEIKLFRQELQKIPIKWIC
jgi:hypothetical protein